jgi:hypothetical protein
MNHQIKNLKYKTHSSVQKKKKNQEKLNELSKPTRVETEHSYFKK